MLHKQAHLFSDRKTKIRSSESDRIINGLKAPPGPPFKKGKGTQPEHTRGAIQQCVPRALISCCAVARAHHLGQNNRFAQQPPRGWLHAAQHAILGAQQFSPKAKKNVARLFFAVGQKKKMGPFFLYFAGVFFFCKACLWKRHMRLGIGNVTDHRLWRMVNTVFICFSLFYRLTWVQRCWPRATTPDCGSVSVISSFLLQDIPRHPETRLLEVREAFKRSLLVFRRTFAHISHIFRCAQLTPNH